MEKMNNTLLSFVKYVLLVYKFGLKKYSIPPVVLSIQK